MTADFERFGTIPADHPALPGHFPGYPITPGVVLLNEIATALEAWRADVRITGWPQVKFVSPLLPGEAYRIRLAAAGAHGCRFTLDVGERVVASGQFTIAERA